MTEKTEETLDTSAIALSIELSAKDPLAGSILSAFKDEFDKIQEMTIIKKAKTFVNDRNERNRDG